MNQWNNEELRKRQSDDEVGFLRMNSSPRRGKLKPALLPLGVAVLGLLLVYVGPVPGLGVLLFIGGLIATLMVLVMSWLGN